MPADVGEVASRGGQALLLAALLLVLVGFLVTLPRLLRVRRRARGLAAQVEAARLEISEGLELLEQQLEEAGESSRPLHRLRKWLTHPLSVAAFQSYRRGRGRR